jgi:hypothetical protein
VFIHIMKLQYLLCLCSLASSVLASDGAGNYQIIFYWYAYRLQVVNHYPLSIATGCPGACLFDDFIAWIHGSSTPFAPTGIRNNLNPAVEDALKRANYQPVTNAARILPGTTFSGQNSFSDLFNPLMAEVQKTRAAMKAAGVDESTSDELNKMKTAISQATAWRRAEQAKSLVPFWESRKYAIAPITKQLTAPDASVLNHP